MTRQHIPAPDVAMAYHKAWASGKLDEAMVYIADDVVCDTPAGRIEGADAYRAFMAPFVEMLINTKLVAVYGDRERAVIVYDTVTKLVPSGPAAECVAVRDGRIVHSRFIFDRLPFQAARSIDES